MRQVCVDANLVVLWLTPEKGRDKAVAFMEDEDGRVALSLLGRFAVDVVPVLSLIAEAWQIAAKHNLSTLYDAYYMALAHLRGCDFWTADQRFLNSVEGVPYIRDIRDFAPEMLDIQDKK